MEIRSIQEFSNNENIIEGCAVKFNTISEILYDKEHKRYFKEVIDKEAITEELINNSDIKFLINHDKNKLVARRKNGEGSLNIEIREDGVYFSFEIPNTTAGNDLKEMIRRKEITQCSFAFTDDSVEWNFTEKSYPLRKVNKCRGIYDLSAVYDAAYTSTEITTRSIEDLEKTQTPISTEVERNDSWKEELNKYRKRLN